MKRLKSIAEHSFYQRAQIKGEVIKGQRGGKSSAKIFFYLDGHFSSCNMLYYVGIPSRIIIEVPLNCKEVIDKFNPSLCWSWL